MILRTAPSAPELVRNPVLIRASGWTERYFQGQTGGSMPDGAFWKLELHIDEADRERKLLERR